MTSWWSVEAQPACQPRWSCPAPAARSWSWTPGTPATPPRRTCRASCPGTGCRPPSSWPTAATRSAATAAGSSPAPSKASPPATRAGSGSCSAVATRSPPDRCFSPPVCATSFPTSTACVNAGPATCCTARTATATRSATGPSASSASAPDAVRYAQIVRQWSDDVVFFAPAGMLTETQRTELVARAIGVVEGTVRRVLITEDQLSGVEMDDGRVIPRDVLFVPPRFVAEQRPAGDSWAPTWTRTAGCAPTPPGRHQRPRALGRRQPGQPPRAGHHRCRRRVRGRHRDERRPRRRRRSPRPFRTSTAAPPSERTDRPDRHRPRARLRPTQHRYPPPKTQRNLGEPCPTTLPANPRPVGPPTKHQLALMIWLAVFPTLTAAEPAARGLAPETSHRSCGPSCWPPSPCPSSSTA